jgi:hypothetical protein
MDRLQTLLSIKRARFLRLKLQCNGPLSNVAFNFSLRRYKWGHGVKDGGCVGEARTLRGGRLLLHGRSVQVDPIKL